MSINLLSPQKKKKLNEYKTIYTIKNIGYFVLLFLIIINLSIYGTYLYLQNQLEQKESEINQLKSSITSEGEISINDIVDEVNEKISQAQNLQSDYILWSDYLSEFSLLVPQNITLNQIVIKQNNNSITISGQAPLRQNFLNFKNNLESSELLTDINSPISNLMKKENVIFSLTAKMVLDNYNL